MNTSNEILDTRHKTIDPQQLKQLHTLLQKQNLTHHKAEMVGGATNGRTESSKELHYNEAADLIRQLQAMESKANPIMGGRGAWKPKPGELQRRKIIAIAYNMQWELPNPNGGKPRVDMQRVNDWCIKFGFGHKKLNDYTAAELPKLVSVFETVYKHYLKAI